MTLNILGVNKRTEIFVVKIILPIETSTVITESATTSTPNLEETSTASTGAEPSTSETTTEEFASTQTTESTVTQFVIKSVSLGFLAVVVFLMHSKCPHYKTYS